MRGEIPNTESLVENCSGLSSLTGDLGWLMGDRRDLQFGVRLSSRIGKKFWRGDRSERQFGVSSVGHGFDIQTGPGSPGGHKMSIVVKT